MISNKIYDILKHRDCISERKQVEILKKGILTGSYMFGGYTDKSDIDIIVMHSDFSMREFEEICVYNQDYNEFEEFTSLYIKSKKGTILNLLIMNEKHNFNIWKKSTKLMVKLISIPILKKAFKNKKIRVEMFEILKKIYGK